MIDDNLIRKILSIAIEKGADYADLFAEKAEYDTITIDDRKLKTDYSFERGVGIRVVSGGRTFYAFTNSFEESNLKKLAAYVRDASGTNGRDGHISVFQSVASTWENPFKISAVRAPAEEKSNLVKAAEERAWQTNYASQVTSRYRDHERRILLASTLNGQVIEHTLGLTELMAVIIVDKNGQREYGFFGKAFYGGLEKFTGENSAIKIAEEASERAARMLTAKDCPRGEMPVVFAPGENGILFHESCGHGMEADLVEKGSIFAGQMGKTVASPLVTMIDDGTIPGYPGSFEFDDEGTPSQKTVMIESGVLKHYLHSSITAQKVNLPLTGSARRESFKHPPLPRMRNTFILAGETDPQDIIKQTKRGLYAVDIGGGGEVNPFTGEFITSIKLGYLIENGELTYPVKGASIIGRGIEALKNIDLVGSDLKISGIPGRCGKGQQVPVGVGMPTVRVRALTVGGAGDAFNGGGQ